MVVNVIFFALPCARAQSTLMRAISNGQVDGFPPADELRTVYVEHDIQASLADLNVLDFVFADEMLHTNGLDVSREEISAMLKDIGFTDIMLESVITSLSGGWKMKLALARAMLMKADILLLDEPTNHLVRCSSGWSLGSVKAVQRQRERSRIACVFMASSAGTSHVGIASCECHGPTQDVKNVAWLENYLTSLTSVTSIIVSHDSGFLDRVCSDIIHYANRKLKVYKGNLSAFVKAVPEAQSYYALEATEQEWRLPEPGFLEGIKSKVCHRGSVDRLRVR